MMAHPTPGQQTAARRRRQIYRAGRDEFRAVWPVAIFAALFVMLTYGIMMYESLFQLPLLAHVK
jgi:hypothetical protein